MVVVKRYLPEHRQLWDDFVRRSKNGVFLFFRAYMEYHADRFTDHSLMFFDDEALLAVLPANVHNGTLQTHGGLTFGGIVSTERMRTPVMLHVVQALLDYLRQHGIARVVYKAIPHIYHRLPAEEDLYALYVHGAQLIRRDVSSTIIVPERPPLAKGRKWGIKRARAGGIVIRPSDDFDTFMAIEEANLREKYDTRPTHTAPEIKMLAGLFPENIKLFAAFRETALLAGVLVYENAHVAHAQYIATTAAGRDASALDALVDHLLTTVYAGLRFFDFGISTEKEGLHLNEGLIGNKESFGGRAVVYDFYELRTAA